MTKARRITAAQVVSRMKAGDQLFSRGGYTQAAGFEDGTRVDGQTIRKLIKAGTIESPVGTSIHTPYTLVRKGEL